MQLSTVDLVIFIGYVLGIIGLGLWVSRKKEGHEKDSKDYFLASKSLPWWAVGTSLIAANISAEQFIGMSGSGFAIGLAIASYEWMAAITLIIVAKFFLPIFIEKNLYTIPQFIEERFSTNLKTILAIFWVALFVFVNLTSVLFLGGKALDTIIGTGDGSLIFPAIIVLGIIAAAYSIYGGLSAVAWTDVVQVVLLVVGGLLTTIIALNYVTPEGGVFAGLEHVYEKAGDKFHMILSRDNPQYFNLPGVAVLIGGMWVANVYYWGFNQYIIQRALAAKSLKEAQRGLVFAAFLKIIIPLIVVIPGIIIYVLYSQPEGTTIIPGIKEAFTSAHGINYDKSYPWLISHFIPSGVKGLVVAALTAAIVSSLASMLNSTSTIFTMDIYKPYLAKKNTSEGKLVKVGRTTSAIALVVAILIAPVMGNIPQMFQYIQEYTGIVSPGILGVFLMGIFWKKTTNKSAIIGVLSSIVVALLLKTNAVDLPFLDQMFYTLIITIVIIMGVSLTTSDEIEDPKGIDLTAKIFRTDSVFNIATYALLIILALLYTVFW
ncbi:MAG: sodium/solute symporter [Melioribacteraceae bacterium]|nr:sodium/solute symporter [Melioribacteraceae bacterium]